MKCNERLVVVFFVMAQASAALLGVRHPQFLNCFDMKVDDVVPTFVLLNLFRANLCQYFCNRQYYKQINQVNFFNVHEVLSEASAAEVADARRGGV